MQCTARSAAFVCSASKGPANASTTRCSTRIPRASLENRPSPSASMLCRRKHTLSLAKPVTSARRLSLRVCAIQVSGPAGGNAGPSDGGNKLDAPVITLMKEKIKTALEAESVEIIDVNGDQQHVSIEVISEFFEGKNSVQRQRAVYKAIWEELQEAVHAVDAMITKTPAEIANK